MGKVVIVGKPNVGKSSLFNRLLGVKKSIVDDAKGVTRDRIESEVKWKNKSWALVDTGGITNEALSFQENIRQQVLIALSEAEVIIFLVSAKNAIDKDDFMIAKMLKKNKSTKVLLVVNKCENKSDYENIKSNVYSLGYGEHIRVSVAHGIGIGDLLDEINKSVSEKKVNQDSIRFCIVGKTNVGKSTLVNTILREERMLVSNIPHTTRDSVDSNFKKNNKMYTIIDTAGIRRKGKITENVEFYSVLRTKDAISRSQIAILLLDGSHEFNEQDETIGGLLHKANIPTIICVNKWDAVKKNTNTMNEMIKLIRSKFKFLSWAPILFVSAKEDERVNTIFSTINDILLQLNIKVNTKLLNDVIYKTQITCPPPLHNGGRYNFTYATQARGQNPTFVLFGNDPKYVSLYFMRFIENTIRKAFNITIVPITVYYKDKNSRNRIK